jgi:hypothetical protein
MLSTKKRLITRSQKPVPEKPEDCILKPGARKKK